MSGVKEGRRTRRGRNHGRGGGADHYRMVVRACVGGWRGRDGEESGDLEKSV